MTIIQQMSIFDYGSIKNRLIEKYAEYGIDDLYIKSCKGCPFKTIHENLSKNKNYTVYLSEVYNELLKYISEGDPYDDFYNRTGIPSIQLSKEHDCIFIYDIKSVGPIYCLEMIKNNLLESESD